MAGYITGVITAFDVSSANVTDKDLVLQKTSAVTINGNTVTIALGNADADIGAAIEGL